MKETKNSSQINLIDDYIEKYKVGINTLYKKYLKNLPYDLFLSSLKQQLLLQEFTENNLDDFYLKLFYATNQFVKSQVQLVKSNIIYICPGCSYLGKQSIVTNGSYLSCNTCRVSLLECKDDKYKLLYQTFAKHNRYGFKCTDCHRFIPGGSEHIVCPYLDCCFVGESKNLKKMRHPAQDESKVNPTITNNPVYHKYNNKASLIKDIIETQSNQLSFSKNNYVVPHKLCIYNAIKELLEEFPEKMVDYLLNNSRSGGFQHKIFQKYIQLLEQSLPVVVKKNKKFITISNILDQNLSIFDGISTFESIVNNNIINNNTKEYYIGGRKASYVKPYYIGKLIGLINNDTKQSILHLVKQYSFNKILVSGIDNDTNVTVTHLRIPPHYQMGAMVHVNRIRKLIIDEAQKYEK